MTVFLTLKLFQVPSWFLLLMDLWWLLSFWSEFLAGFSWVAGKAAASSSFLELALTFRRSSKVNEVWQNASHQSLTRTDWRVGSSSWVGAPTLSDRLLEMENVGSSLLVHLGWAVQNYWVLSRSFVLWVFKIASNWASTVSLGKVFLTNTIHCQEVILKLSLIFPFFVCPPTKMGFNTKSLFKVPLSYFPVRTDVVSS